MTLPTQSIFLTNGHTNKFIIIDEKQIINLKNVSYIDIVDWNVVGSGKQVRIVMNDGYTFEIICNDHTDADEIVYQIYRSFSYESDKNIIEISSRIF